MKHKLLFGFAAAAMAAVMCVGFAACGGGPDAKGVKGEEITEEQWNNAYKSFRGDDAKFTLELSLKMDVDDDNSGTSYVSLVQNGAKSSLAIRGEGKSQGKDVEDKTIEYYAEAKDSQYTVYMKDEDDKWTASTLSSNPYDLDFVLDMMPVDVGRYSEYKYDADQKGYVLKEVPEGETSPVLKFDKDGRLIAIYLDGKVNMGLGTTVDVELNLVIDYDAKDITLPTVE